jgi:hypothetical protein
MDGAPAESAPTPRTAVPDPKTLIPRNIVIALIGVALIIISPLLIQSSFSHNDFTFRNIALVIGISFLIIGGYGAAIGFIKSGSTHPSPQSELAGSMKACPECAESIKDAAKICRFCGHRFS